ncbi:MAG: NAD(P)-binding protein, partial [Isosphaeraceae bacterium]
MAYDQSDYDLVVVGGGIGGLALAALAQRKGLKTALCESHTHLGGCAGYFQRGPFTFDCGATALMGLAAGEPIRALLDRVGLDFHAIRTSEYRMCLASDELVMTCETADWESTIRRHFPELGENAVRFWRIQEKIGKTMFAAASGLPRLPLCSPADIF